MSILTRTLSLTVVLPALFVGACLSDEETALGTEAQAVTKCPYWGCGENSPKINVWDFHELDEAGTANSAGVRLLSLKKNGDTYHPNVIGARLYGESRVLPTLAGTNLIGAYLEVSTRDGTFQIQIKNVSNTTTFWVGPPTTIETYELAYYKPFSMTHPEPLCKNPPSRLDAEGRMWSKTLEAILYTGDRYDEPGKRVTASTYAEAGTWFNIGCAGSALAKLHLNRHTTAASTSSYQTSWQQRQALLKMYVSDICGTGEAFTKLGTPLHWANASGWTHLVGNEAAHEAYWTHDGALCLDTHRLWNDSVIADQIATTCPDIEPCATLPGYPNPWAAGAYIDTAIP